MLFVGCAHLAPPSSWSGRVFLESGPRNFLCSSLLIAKTTAVHYVAPAPLSLWGPCLFGLSWRLFVQVNVLSFRSFRTFLRRCEAVSSWISNLRSLSGTTSRIKRVTLLPECPPRRKSLTESIFLYFPPSFCCYPFPPWFLPSAFFSFGGWGQV